MSRDHARSPKLTFAVQHCSLPIKIARPQSLYWERPDHSVLKQMCYSFILFETLIYSSSSMQ